MTVLTSTQTTSVSGRSINDDGSDTQSGNGSIDAACSTQGLHDDHQVTSRKSRTVKARDVKLAKPYSRGGSKRLLPDATSKPFDTINNTSVFAGYASATSVYKKKSLDKLLRENPAENHGNILQLIEKKENLNRANDYGVPLLHTAIAWKQPVSVISAIIEKNADLNKLDGVGWTPLMYASYYNRTEVAEVLWSYNSVPLDFLNEYGETALYVAARSGHLEMVRWLFDRGANPEIKGMGKNAETAINIAERNQHSEIVKLLKSKAG